MPRSSIPPNLDHQDRLNKTTPAARDVKLGTVLAELIASHNALLAKLDADTALVESDYVDDLRVKPLTER